VGDRGNVEIMQEEGLIDDSEERLPDAYYAVIEKLTGGEIEALVSLKQKMDDAGIPTGPLTASYVDVVRFVPPF
jgi:hypothetical protein